jgi:hypothetical protein
MIVSDNYKKAKQEVKELKKNNDELKESNKKLQEKYDILIEKYDIKRDELEEMMIEYTKPDTNPNVFSFVEGNFLNTKPLEPIIDEDVPKLKQLSNILEKENGKMEMCNILQHHSLHKTLKNFVGNLLRSIYEKKDKKTQQFFVTDCSRLSYIVRDIADRELVWKRDKKGIIVAKRIISPILQYIRSHISDNMGKYLSYILEKFPYDKLESVDRIQRLTQIITEIDDGRLQHNILKYLAFYFQLDKAIMENSKKKMIRKKKGINIKT